MMKVYLYYDRKRIARINDPDYVKKQICSYFAKNEPALGALTPEDVIISTAKITAGIDVYFVLNQMLGSNPAQMVQKVQQLKAYLNSVMQEDQKTKMSYKINVKADEKYQPMAEKRPAAANRTEEPEGQRKSGRMEQLPQEMAELDYETRAKAYVPVEPSYSFDRVILPAEVLEKMEAAINILRYEQKVFEEWGLYEIQPHPSSSLSFFGPSGTGKTMAAEAIAEKLGKKILKVSYADVESKFHGEGPKMIKAIFLAAAREDAVLFFDEADSLLSKRLTNVTQGSEQAINSMRSQLLICLEEFHGIVIFATNLIVNYDNAFLTRLISIEFPLPDEETREKIWNVHIRPANDGKQHRLCIPLSEDVDTRSLAAAYSFAGREIRNAVIDACVHAAMQEKEIVTQDDFIKACEKIVAEKASVAKAGDYTSSKKQDAVKEAVMNVIKEGRVTHVSTSTEP